MKKGMDIYHVETGGDMMAAMVGLEKHECYDVAASDTAVCADGDAAVASLGLPTQPHLTRFILSCERHF